MRNTRLDAIRGFAVMGILLMNISAFGLPAAAYLNPAWRGLPGLRDGIVWGLLDLFAQVKFLFLFAMLFGVGLLLQLPRGGRWIRVRLGWLALLGLIHSLFFWDGDILLDYALVGLLLWRLMAALSAEGRLLSSGIFLWLVGTLVLVPFGLLAGDIPGPSWLPGAADLEYEAYWKLSGGLEALRNRADLLQSSLLALLAQYGWQLAGAMLIGAALWQSGWLRGQRPAATYRRHAWRLMLAGVLIQLPGLLLQVGLQWRWPWTPFWLQIPRDLGAPLMALGYVALIHAAWAYLARGWLMQATARVGRMALSNYLLQTLLCSALFWHGALFMHLDRLALLLLVPLIWCVNLLFSTLWLRIWSQGPLEALWRWLTRRCTAPPA
ncbi:DUF418 domain-containing protein YeiB [Pantoea sp. 1.19]|uniref:DUF418 domain-containing protein YeiB n=1 Tax=Pantoea sp. 1.19 TaxID=1925589 RepID=UPI000948AD15|nr:DUF418 domain-containing protein YeiB [Pantoea sp. 1.19]